MDGGIGRARIRPSHHHCLHPHPSYTFRQPRCHKQAHMSVSRTSRAMRSATVAAQLAPSRTLLRSQARRISSTAQRRGNEAQDPSLAASGGDYNMTKFAPFNWEDPMRVEDNLTEEETSIRDNARAFCQEQLLPKVTEMYRNEVWDPSILPGLGEMGLLGPTIEGYGCAGVNNVSYGLITRELERVDSGYRSIMSVQSSLCMGAINQFGTDGQKEKFLPRMAKGELVGCFGLTEPNHGSDPSGMETVVEDDGDGHFVINGSKTWISSSPYADVAIIWARAKWDNKVRGFLVEKGTKGFSCPPIKNKLMLRASVTGSIFLDNVRVKASDAFLSRAKPGLGAPFECLNSARFGITWGAIGALEACIAESRQYALDRKQFNKPLAGFQLQQKKIADASTEASLGLLASLQLGRAKDQGTWSPEMVSLVKRNNCGKAVEHARKLAEIFGGNAASDEYHIGRHMANLHVVNTYEGTYDIHGLILGKGLTGVPAFA